MHDNIPEFTEETFDSSESLSSDIKNIASKPADQIAEQITKILFGPNCFNNEVKKYVELANHENIVLKDYKQIIIKGEKTSSRVWVGTPAFKDEMERVE